MLLAHKAGSRPQSGVYGEFMKLEVSPPDQLNSREIAFLYKCYNIAKM